jgi:hypothetical protein
MKCFFENRCHGMPRPGWNQSLDKMLKWTEFVHEHAPKPGDFHPNESLEFVQYVAALKRWEVVSLR